jgi:hypothetical protein
MAEHKFKIGERVYFHSRLEREAPFCEMKKCLLDAAEQVRARQEESARVAAYYEEQRRQNEERDRPGAVLPGE